MNTTNYKFRGSQSGQKRGEKRTIFLQEGRLLRGALWNDDVVKARAEAEKKKRRRSRLPKRMVRSIEAWTWRSSLAAKLKGNFSYFRGGGKIMIEGPPATSTPVSISNTFTNRKVRRRR